MQSKSVCLIVHCKKNGKSVTCPTTKSHPNFWMWHHFAVTCLSKTQQFCNRAVA